MTENKGKMERVVKALKHMRSASKQQKKKNKKTDEATKRQMLINKALEAKAYARAVDAERDAEFYEK